MEIGIKRDYLKKLCELYENHFGNFNECPTLSIDTTKLDLVNSIDDQDKVIELIQNSVKVKREMKLNANQSFYICFYIGLEILKESHYDYK